MPRRTIVSLVASIIVGTACIATASTEASAYYRRGVGVYHGGVYRGGVYRGGYYRGVRPGVAVGAAAVLLPSVLPLPQHITRHAADIIPIRRATSEFDTWPSTWPVILRGGGRSPAAFKIKTANEVPADRKSGQRKHPTLRRISRVTRRIEIRH